MNKYIIVGRNDGTGRRRHFRTLHQAELYISRLKDQSAVRAGAYYIDAPKLADLLTTYLGSIVTIQAISDNGLTWLQDNIASAEIHEDTVYVEHRFAFDIIEGALAHGLTCQDTVSGRLAERKRT